MPHELEYRNDVRVERGGTARRVYGARRQLNRLQHDLVIAATENVSTAVEPRHRSWAYDLRRGRLRIYGGLLRFIDRLHRLGFSKDEVMMIPSSIADYIHALYGDRPVERRATTKRAA